MVGAMRAALAAAAMVLTGCATVQAPPQERTTVPRERLLVPTAQGEAEIVVVRDVGFLTHACFSALMVNRALVARMDTGETLRIRVPAGDLLLAVGRDPEGQGLCAVGKDYKVQREFAIKAGETKHFRMTIGSGGIDIMRSDF